MTIIEVIFAALTLLLGAWAGVIVYVVWQDWQVRRAWRAQDERAEWRAKVDAMRRIHDEQLDAYRDDRGDA